MMIEAFAAFVAFASLVIGWAVAPSRSETHTSEATSAVVAPAS